MRKNTAPLAGRAKVIENEFVCADGVLLVRSRKSADKLTQETQTSAG